MLPANARPRAISIVCASSTMRAKATVRDDAILYSYPVWPSSGRLPRFGSRTRSLSGAARTRRRPRRCPPCASAPSQPCGRVRVPPVVACLESAPARSLSAKAVPHPVCLCRFGAWTPSPAGTPTAWKAVRVFLAPTAAAAAARTSGGAVRVLPNYHLSVLDCLLARRTQLVTWASMT